MNTVVNVLTAIGAGVILAGLALSSFDVYRRFRNASYRRQVEFGALTLILIAVVVAALAQ